MRHLYASLLLFLLVLIPARAQHAFQTFLPGLSHAMKRPAVQTSDGGFCILAGHDEGGTSSFVLVKTTSDGAMEWTHKFSTVGLNDRPIAIRSTQDGGFLVVGVTSIPDSWDQDVLVMRINAHGYPVWSRTYDYSDIDWASDVVMLEDGSAVIVGSTYVTDSATASAEIEQAVLEEYGSEVYKDYTNEKTLALRIDPEGEILWGGYLKEVPIGDADDVIWKAFAQAACRRNDNSITLIEQASHDYSFSSSIIVNITNDGTASSGLWMRGQGTDEDPIARPYANDLASLPGGDCFIAGVSRYYASSWDVVDEGFLLRIDENNQVVWSRTYIEESTPIPMTVAPIDDKRYLIASRTTYTSESGSEIDNPVVAIADSDGAISEAKQWITSFHGLPAGESEEGERKLELWWPHFIPTDDQGILSVGSVLMRDDYEYYSSHAGLMVARFNPDLSLCGDEIRSATVSSAVAGESHEAADISYSADWNPLDVTSGDFRTTAMGRLVAVEDVPMQLDLPIARSADDDGGYSEMGVGAISESEPDLADFVEDSGNEKSQNITHYEPAPLPQPADDSRYADSAAAAHYPDEEEIDFSENTEENYHEESDVVADYQYEEEIEQDDYIGENLTDEDIGTYGSSEGPVAEYGEVGDSYGYGADDGLEQDEEILDRTAYPPAFAQVDVTLVRLALESKLLSDVAVDDFEIAPFFLCGESPMIGTSSAPARERSVEAEYLHVLPNSIQKGKSAAVEFRLQADEMPEVNLVSVGRGEVAARLEAKSIIWSETDGTGSATIETVGLAAGVYLVQVRSGEKQLTGKLEVR